MSYSYTRREARRDVAELMGDLLVATVEANSSSGVLIDSTIFIDRDNRYAGIKGVVFSATNSANAGHRFTITGSGQSSHSISIDPPLPVDPTPGDVVHLFNLFGRGWPPDTYDRTIAMAVDLVFPAYMLLETYDLATFSYYEPSITTLPENWFYVYKIEIVRGTNDRFPIPERWWDTDPALHEVKIQGLEALDMAHGMPLRIFGCTKPPVPALDSDVISVHKQWLLYKVAGMIGGTNKTDRAARTDAVNWANYATQLEPATDVWNLPTLKQIRWAP